MGILRGVNVVQREASSAFHLACMHHICSARFHASFLSLNLSQLILQILRVRQLKRGLRRAMLRCFPTMLSLYIRTFRFDWVDALRVLRFSCDLQMQLWMGGLSSDHHDQTQSWHRSASSPTHTMHIALLLQFTHIVCVRVLSMCPQVRHRSGRHPEPSHAGCVAAGLHSRLER